ncbi:hypothetical protein [Halorussus halophilus]|uniref:hypothetical protein n=1 Tax=Halorussus halophilus TaxID=2650975 RepID=UPI0013013AF0|nr:hypothetical protein [Halorussus halophilus]
MSDDSDAEETEESETTPESPKDDDSGVTERVDELVTRAEESIDGLQEYVEDPESDLADLREQVEDEASVSEAAEYVHDLWEVADEAEDIAQTVDLSDLPEAVEPSELHEVIEEGELPDAISSGNPGDAVKLRKLLKVVKLTELWDAADVRAFWKQKREFENELEDVVDNGEEDGDAVDDADDSLAPSVDWSPDASGSSDFDPESMENAIQSKMMDGVEEFREALLGAHEKLKALREENRERTSSQDSGVNSRNPTAHSTMPSGGRSDVGHGTRHSTVPRETRYSTAPNKRRIYGTRFEEERDDG